jgi:hypothetical protein
LASGQALGQAVAAVMQGRALHRAVGALYAASLLATCCCST